MSCRRQPPTSSFQSFADLRARSFLLCLLTCFILILTTASAFAQATAQSGSSSAKNVSAKNSPVSPGNTDFSLELSETDIEETIKNYRTGDPAQAVRVFQGKMTLPITDAKIREDILQQLPETVRKLKIDDTELAAKFRKVITPVLALFSREQIYDVIIFRHPTPVMFSDSGVVIVVSSGMIERIISDDELLGYVAHEIAHEYYAKYSIYTKYLLKMITEGGNESALKNKLAETLMLIELQCDGFAGLTLAYLNRNSLAFIEGLERTGRDFPTHGTGFHPPDSVRRKLVEQIIPQKYLGIKPKVSEALLDLKASLEKILKSYPSGKPD